MGRRVDLQPILDGSHTAAEPGVGGARLDCRPMLYAAKWHTVIAPTETYKTTFMLWHSAEVLQSGGSVVYLHFEETDASGTVGKLREMTVPDDIIRNRLVWLDCDSRWRPGEFATELASLPDAPELIVLDGINRFCGKHGVDPEKTTAVDLHRDLLVDPGTQSGACVVSIGHPVKSASRREERHGYGSTAWLDIVDGVAFRLEKSTKPPGRGRIGYVDVYLVKDRPGNVKRHGIQDSREDWYLFGSLEIDHSNGTDLLAQLLPPATTTTVILQPLPRKIAQALSGGALSKSEVQKITRGNRQSVFREIDTMYEQGYLELANRRYALTEHGRGLL